MTADSSPAKAGIRAKNALLHLHGESLELLDLLVQLLISKGVLTDDEWSEVLMGWAEGPGADARRRLDPDQVEALDAFFGG